ncbi:hypothetical protein VB712_14100 [Spirulina sp. CCNP1310]|uniref:hypothetical protein n=1 Tax=Spirulina sp. CCNP1310 TaxID=3110249 RepID=UPI002B2027FA|nr:hypothetical protein [Spirulina sp. CCNP1310]MEA5420360.1 hypothetical protein [Spirulina sp. CCNP1310]
MLNGRSLFPALETVGAIVFVGGDRSSGLEGVLGAIVFGEVRLGCREYGGRSFLVRCDRLFPALENVGAIAPHPAAQNAIIIPVPKPELFPCKSP